MDITTIRNKLNSAGLSQKEADAYVICLQKGRVTPALVAKETGEKRTTIYHILDDLRQRGIVLEEHEDGKKLYRAAPLTVWKKQADERRAAVEEMVPMLKQLLDTKPTDPRTESFYGSAVTKVFDRMLATKNKQVLVFRPLADIEDIAGREYHFSKRRLAAGIHIKYLESRDHPHPADYARQHAARLREVMQLPSGTSMPVTVIVWDQTVAWIAPTEKFAVLTESQDFAAFMRMVFETLWSVSKRI